MSETMNRVGTLPPNDTRSSNHISLFGELEKNVWISSCRNCVGVACGTISGRLLTEAA